MTIDKVLFHGSPVIFGGYLIVFELVPLRQISNIWKLAIPSKDDVDVNLLPDWKRIVSFLNGINKLNLPGLHGELPVEWDPRVQHKWKTLPPMDQAMSLITFQKKCVKNLLSYFKNSMNPLDWEEGVFHDDGMTALLALQVADSARYDAVHGVAFLAQARDTLASAHPWNNNWRFAFLKEYDEDDEQDFWYDAGMCDESFAEAFTSYIAFYGANYLAEDPADADFSDEKIIEYATSELGTGTPYESRMVAPIITMGPRFSMKALLGPHGSACDIFGAWMDDPEAALQHALGLGVRN